MRNLATIQRIEEIQPIEGADKIDKARIKGWWVVVKKGEFKPGDLCVYFEIDSFLPVRPEFEFLLRGSKPKKMIHEGRDRQGIRLKTINLRGQLSQGLALPPAFLNITQTEVGFDCSEILDVVKYEPPIPASLSGEHAGEFPDFIPKTDEERIQNLPDLLTTLKGKRFYVTSKIDGTSVTYYRYNGHFGVCGRNFEIKENDVNILWKMAKTLDLANKLPEGFAVQGECAGEAIQDNRLKARGQDVYVFYVFDISRREYLQLPDLQAFCANLGMRTVPLVNDNFILDHTVDDLLKMADAPSPLNPNVPQEGLVFRLWGTTRKTSFKAISNAYLLKYGE